MQPSCLSLVGEQQLTRGLVKESPDIYDLTHLIDIQNWCDNHGCAYWEYVKQCEDNSIGDYLLDIWHAMQQSVEAGLNHEGRLPGPLNLQRKAATYYVKAQGYKSNLQSRGMVYAYALAVSEENASGGTIVTAPTCGSCGVVPGVLYHLAKGHNFSDEKMIHALATAGLIGNIVKENASISGADVGCQGEVGVACAMASGAACQALWRFARTDRVCRRDGLGTSPWHDVRPGLWFGSDTLHRAQCLCRHEGARLQSLCVVQ